MCGEIVKWSKQVQTRVVVGAIFILLLLVLFGYIWWPSNKCEEHGALLRVMMAKQAYAQGESIPITFEVQNLREAELGLVYGSSPLIDFNIFLFDEQGLPVPRTDEGEKKFFGASSRIIGRLSPDRSSYTRTFEIDPFFELSKPGTYTMTVEKLAGYENCPEMTWLTETVSFTRLP